MPKLPRFAARLASIAILQIGIGSLLAAAPATRSPGSRLTGVSVRNIGALGDGRTDDTRAIQAARNTGRKVVIPEGTFFHTNELEPVSDQEVEIIGPLKVADANVQPLAEDVVVGQPRVKVVAASRF